MIRFHILGIPVEVDPWFWITMALIGGGLNVGSLFQMLHVFVFVFAAFLSILIHEIGHALMIRKYGLPTAIRLQAFGGFASYPTGSLNRGQSFMVTAAGPVTQFALGVSLLLLSQHINIPQDSLFLPFLRNLIWVSLVWAILNCLPIYPLDGGQMLSAVLGPGNQSHVYLIGVIVSVGVGVFGYLALKTILLPILMALFAWQNWQAYRMNSG